MESINVLFSIIILCYLSKIQSLCEEQKKTWNIDQCTNDSNCTLNSFCHHSGSCYCKDGYSPYREPITLKKTAYHTICLKEASFIGDLCTKDIQCKATFGTHAMCNQEDPNNQVGQCQCLEDAHYIDGLCYKTSLIGELCEVNDNCLVKSKNIEAFCTYSRCTCPPHYHPTTDKRDCQPISALGGPCVDDTGCSVFNSECSHGFCRCRQKYIPVHERNYCLLLAEKLEDPCDESSQCSIFLQNTICDEERGVCVCDNDAHNVNGSCWKSAKLLEPCSHNAECSINKVSRESVVCNLGICQCKIGYSMEERNYCAKLNITRISVQNNAARKISDEIFFSIETLLLMTLLAQHF